MKRKVTFEVDDTVYRWIIGFIAMVEHATGQALSPVIKEIREGQEVIPDRSTVRYHAVGAREAVEALGERTIVGIIYSHLLDQGPKTAKEIRAEKGFNMKTIEATIYRLRQMDLVQSQEIE